MTNTLSRQGPEPFDNRQKKRANQTISCRICQAMYAPSQEHSYLLQAPPVALESAFMSTCHFCFRCRRPACLNCWDNVHGVCGECCLEANLPFRAQVAPLRGVLFATTRQAQLRRKHAIPVRLICVRPGRFQNLAPIDTAETLQLQKTIAPAPTYTYPENSVQHHSRNPERQIGHIPTRPPQPRVTIALDEMTTRPPQQKSNVEIDTIATRQGGKKKNYGRRVEQVFSTFLLLLLLCIVFGIVLALISPESNTLILRFSHIDIRTEITYLWQLIKQLHF